MERLGKNRIMRSDPDDISVVLLVCLIELMADYTEKPDDIVD